MFAHQPIRRKGSQMLKGTNWFMVLAVFVAGALVSEGRAWNTHSDGAAASPETGALYRVTSTFASTGPAVAAGYLPASTCPSEFVAGMRIDYAHAHLLDEPIVAIERPQLLRYEMGSGGGLRLRAVAYRVVQRAWHDAGNGLRPTLFGLPFELVEQPGEEPVYQLFVSAITARARAQVEAGAPLADCARAELEPAGGGEVQADHTGHGPPVALYVILSAHHLGRPRSGGLTMARSSERLSGYGSPRTTC
jgi:hypothetical protein